MDTPQRDPSGFLGPAATPRKAARLRAQLLIAGCLTGFCALMVAVVFDPQPYFGWDLAVSREVQSASWPGFESLMRGVSFPGDSVLWAGLALLAPCLLLLGVRARREAAVLILAVASAQAIKIAIKNIVGRPRPSADLVNVMINAKEIHSFPSGHTVHYIVFFGFLCFLTLTLVKPRALRWPLLVFLGALVFLVGPARIYLGAHWVSDVLAGYLLGGALLVGYIGLYRWWSSPRAAIPTLSSAQVDAAEAAGDVVTQPSP